MITVKGKILGAVLRESKAGNRYAVGTVELAAGPRTREGRVRLPFLAFGLVAERAREAIGGHALLIGQVKSGRGGLEFIADDLRPLEVEEEGGRFSLIGEVVGTPRETSEGTLVHLAVSRRSGVEVIPVLVPGYTPAALAGRSLFVEGRLGGRHVASSAALIAALVAEDVSFLRQTDRGRSAPAAVPLMAEA